uniref:Translation initiation factor IF-2 n=1 Tax=Streptomyces olivaceus TaxID=47716 RepID=A0A0M7BHI6_STROV|nr:translation initiation factor IF-2 [Streptomyces olivaceus]
MGRDAERRRRNWAHGGRSGSRAARPDRREPCGESRRHPGADRSPSTRPYGADRPRRGPGRPGRKPALRNFPLSPSAAPMPLRPTERRPACRPPAARVTDPGCGGTDARHGPDAVRRCHGATRNPRQADARIDPNAVTDELRTGRFGAVLVNSF